MRCVRIVVVMGTLLLWVAPSSATVTYEYKGNPFTTVMGPYTTSDFVSITFTTPDVLAPNLKLQNVAASVIHSTFSDGVRTFSDPVGTPGLPNPSVFVSTDSNGNIVGPWSVFSFPQAADGQQVSTTTNGLDVYDIGAIGLDVAGENSNSPGAWVTIVPEPSTISLSARF